MADGVLFGCDTFKDLIRVQRDTPQPSCPGGIGNFGFNSYDLLTFSLMVMGAVSSAVIVNTNKNENNDNNNDLQSSFGQINTNNQMATADQTSTNMAMITVPPSGTPVVVPLGGRMLSDGTMNLLEQVKYPGTQWESKQFIVNDKGEIYDKFNNKTVKGITAFGSIDERNVFHMLSNVTWETFRKNQVSRSTKLQINTDKIAFNDTPVFVPTKDLDLLFDQTLEEFTLKLVLISVPNVGPPIVLPIGVLLQDGEVWLNNGMEIEGIFWESPDRVLHENGTILYKLTKTTEQSQIVFATLDREGSFNKLQTGSLSLFRSLNSKPGSKNLQASIGDFTDESWTSIKKSLSITRKKRSLKDTIKQSLSLNSLLLRDKYDSSSMLTQHLICSMAKKLDLDFTNAAVLKYKPNHYCFYKNVLHWCAAAK